jgi:hypothetical protein
VRAGATYNDAVKEHAERIEKYSVQGVNWSRVRQLEPTSL